MRDYDDGKTLHQEFLEQTQRDQFAKARDRTEEGLRFILLSQTRLINIIKGMEALLRTELGYDEDWFQASVREVQDRDHVIKCPNCSRVIGRGKDKCIYCGQIVEIDDIFHFVNITPISLPKSATVKRATAEKRVEYAYEKVLELEKGVEPLISIAETLWVILKERFGFSDEQLAERLDEEKPQPQAASVCPSCGRTVGNGRASCLYCGTPV